MALHVGLKACDKDCNARAEHEIAYALSLACAFVIHLLRASVLTGYEFQVSLLFHRTTGQAPSVYHMLDLSVERGSHVSLGEIRLHAICF